MVRAEFRAGMGCRGVLAILLVSGGGSIHSQQGASSAAPAAIPTPVPVQTPSPSAPSAAPIAAAPTALAPAHAAALAATPAASLAPETPLAQPARPLPPGAVVLDHVVAVINGSVILQSDIDEEMSYAVLQPFSIRSARNTPQRALQRLIDRDLILQQMETAQTVDPPSAEEVQQRIVQLRSVIPECEQYQCQKDMGWQAFLQAKGLTEKEVEQHWSQRMLILSFIQSRFGTGVRISPAEIADYYNQRLVPQFEARKVKAPPLETISTRIEEILLQQRVSSLLLEWLQSLKNEGSVSIWDHAYGQVGTTGQGDDADAEGQS